MARIVKKEFTLNIQGEHKAYKVGDILEGDAAGHWYAEAHSEAIPETEKAETAAQKKAREKAEKEAAAKAETEKAETDPAGEAGSVEAQQ